MVQAQEIDYNKLGKLVREIVREELEEARLFNSKYIEEVLNIQKEKGVRFNSISDLDKLVDNV
jgi:hypothetical protein